MNGTLWRDDAKIRQLTRLPWTIRTARCEISGEYLGWAVELPGTCAATLDPAKLPNLIKRSIAANIRVRLYMGERLPLPVASTANLTALGWPEPDLKELWTASARPDWTLDNDNN
jgi:hypothetical protein